MWHPVLQNTIEPCPCCGKTWMELRAGKVTGSTIKDVMAWHDKPLKTGPKWGEPAKRLAVEIAVVELGGKPTENSYSNAHMERGHEQEPIARALYEAEYFCEVTNGGFIEGEFRTGCSPDGPVRTDGMVEIKCQINHVHYDCIERDDIPSAYRWQVIWNLKVSGREWIDFISYCATFPADKRLYVKRLYAKDLMQEFQEIDKRLKEFWEFVDNVKGRIGK